MKALLRARPGNTIPSISPMCAQARRRFTQVIHMVVHRKACNTFSRRAGRQRASVPVLARGGRHPGRGSGLGLAMSYRSGARLGGVVAPREPMTWPGAVRHVRPRSRLQLGRLSSRCYFWLPDVAWKRNSTTSPSRLWAVLTCPLLARRPGPDCPANTYAVRASIRCSVTEPGSSSSSTCFTSPGSDR